MSNIINAEMELPILSDKPIIINARADLIRMISI